jgi:hypothetical protein
MTRMERGRLSSTEFAPNGVSLLSSTISLRVILSGVITIAGDFRAPTWATEEVEGYSTQFKVIERGAKLSWFVDRS